MGRDAGRYAGRGSLAAFETFISERKAQNDWHEYVNPAGTALLREKVAAACGFRRQVLHQNMAVKTRLRQLEQQLRGDLVLAPGNPSDEAPPSPQDGDGHAFRMEQLKTRVQENQASLEAVRERLEAVEQQLLLITGE